MRKPVFGDSDQVRDQPGCTATEDVERHEISDLADMRLCFRICKNPVFLITRLRYIDSQKSVNLPLKDACSLMDIEGNS